MDLDRRIDIAIAGAGVAGLTAALCLAERGHRVRIFDAASELKEVGAGIQLSPNAMHVLRRLGLESALRVRAARPRALEVLDGLSGRRLNSIPLGETVENRHGAPYLVIHRAALQTVLVDTAHAHPFVDLVLDAPVSDVHEGADSASFIVGTTSESADLLIAADGVKSGIRRSAFSAPAPTDTGAIAWRATIPAQEAPGCIAMDTTRLWLAPQTHLVSYPVENGNSVNLVLITHGSEDDSPPFERFHGSLQELAGIAEWLRWPLRANDPSLSRIRGPIVLVGDAAHAMLPTAAQGGAQAIEDGWTLAAAIAVNTDRERALARWSVRRIARVTRIHEEATRNLRIYGLSGPAGLARNMAIAALPSRLHLARLDWIYGWKPEKAAL